MSRFDKSAGDYKSVVDETVAWAGDDLLYYAEYKAKYIAQILGRTFSGKALDFGCGIGLLSRLLKRLLPSLAVDGFDVSTSSLLQVDPELRAQGVFTSHRGDLDHDYDLIIAANVLHHIPPQARQEMLRGIHERLAPVGHLFVFEHNPLNPLTRLVVSRCPLDQEAVLLRADECTAWVAGAGLHVVRRDYIGFSRGSCRGSGCSSRGWDGCHWERNMSSTAREEF